MNAIKIKHAATQMCEYLLNTYHKSSKSGEVKITTTKCLDAMLWLHSQADGKYLGCHYWSNAAVDSFKRYGKAQTSKKTFGHLALRHDHLVPRAYLIDNLLKRGPITDLASLLDRCNIGVVITVDEHEELQKKGLANKGNIENPWARYNAVEISLADAADVPTAPEPSRRRRFAENNTISLLVCGNPKRKGSSSSTRFDLYKSGMTVIEFLSAGGRREDLAWDVDHNFITIY